MEPIAEEEEEDPVRAMKKLSVPEIEGLRRDEGPRTTRVEVECRVAERTVAVRRREGRGETGFVEYRFKGGEGSGGLRGLVRDEERGGGKEEVEMDEAKESRCEEAEGRITLEAWILNASRVGFEGS